MKHSLPHFELAIQQHGDQLTVEVVRASGGRPVTPTPLRLPFTLEELPRRREDAADWVLKAGVSRLRTSREVLQKTRSFGSELFRALFPAPILARFRQCRELVPPDNRLRVLLQMPPALALVPWELVYDPLEEGYLSLAPDLSLGRYSALGQLKRRLQAPVPGPVRVLVVLASPSSSEYARLDVQRELRRIETAFEPLQRSGRVLVDVIKGRSTIEQLRRQLKQPAHIVHFFCHGDLNYESGEGVLVFEDQDGAPEPTSASLLRNYVQQQSRNTRLVVLNACLGALPAGDDHFSSIGSALMHGGAPAVVAMQFELSADAADQFTRVFYAELVEGAPVDAALAQARLHLNGAFPTRLDWTVPVLFLRSEDLLIFPQTAEAAATARADPPPARSKPADSEPEPRPQPAAPSQPAFASPKDQLSALEFVAKQGSFAELDRLLLGNLLESIALPIELRLRAARLASQVGDSREGVCTEQPLWATKFPAGTYQLALGASEVKVNLAAFQLSRYAVTVWQYRRFVLAGGYSTERYWTVNGWKVHRSRALVAPEGWEDLDELANNQPVVGVCWYEAAAFCRWLTEHGHAGGWLQPDEVLRLPSEAEWTVGATIRPGEFAPVSEALAVGGGVVQHTSEYRLGRPAPVGVFVEGCSPCGAADMAGNVWEWCSTLFEADLAAQQQGDERLDFAPDGDQLVLRGGSYGLPERRGGSNARSRGLPQLRDRFKGFRLLRGIRRG